MTAGLGDWEKTTSWGKVVGRGRSVESSPQEGGAWGWAAKAAAGVLLQSWE